MLCMPLSSIELQQVASLHGGDTGSTPVRDASTLQIYYLASVCFPRGRLSSSSEFSFPLLRVCCQINGIDPITYALILPVDDIGPPQPIVNMIEVRNFAFIASTQFRKDELFTSQISVRIRWAATPLSSSLRTCNNWGVAGLPISTSRFAT
jgi:hypothetical protein